MVVVGSVWEFGWNTPIKEFDLWYYPLKEFGVDEIAFTPISGIRLNNKGVEFDSIQSMVDHYNIPVIICSESGDTNIEDFVHPKDAIYLFNRTSGGELPITADYSVKVSTHLNQGMLWGHQAASIILYDRFKKWQ